MPVGSGPQVSADIGGNMRSAAWDTQPDPDAWGHIYIPLEIIDLEI